MNFFGFDSTSLFASASCACNAVVVGESVSIPHRHKQARRMSTCMDDMGADARKYSVMPTASQKRKKYRMGDDVINLVICMGT